MAYADDPAELVPVSSHFRRSQRILNGADFVRVMRTGRRFGNVSFTIYIDKSPANHARLGVAVGRKVSLKAVTRNAIKRVIRESFRQHASELPALDIVFNARPAAAKKNTTMLAAEITEALQKIKRNHHQRVTT